MVSDDTIRAPIDQTPDYICRVLKKTATEDEIVNLVAGSSQDSGRQLRRSVRANR